MKNRVVQVMLIALVGALLAWLLLRDDEPSQVTADRVEEVLPTGTPAKPAPADPAPARPPPKVTFRLPKMGAAKGEAPPPPKPSGAIQIPKDWLLRGSGSKNYELRSDRATAFT